MVREENRVVKVLAEFKNEHGHSFTDSLANGQLVLDGFCEPLAELYKVEWLREVEPHRAWINPVDAEPRGIKDGDEVYVFNDRGKVAITAWVTERIIPGVISIFEGAWYNPDKDGIDRGACANTLTNNTYSGGGACVLNTSLVQVEKA